MRARITPALLLSMAALAGGALPASGSPLEHPWEVISEDTTWTKAGSPYVYPDGVWVDREVTLTIEPGVRVEAQDFRMAGAMIARGTEAEPIVFTGVQGSSWDGIHFFQDAWPESAIEHAHIENAQRGLSMRGAAFPVHDTLFTGNAVALWVDNPDMNLTFTGNEFYSNVVAFRGRTSGVVGLYENDFWDNEVAMLFQAQSPFECQNAPGIFDVHYNDILRGPDSPWFSFDVRASDESGTSGMVVSASDNWWGTVDREDIEARLHPRVDCCPASDRVDIEWRDPAVAPQTAAEPPGPIGTPSPKPSMHGDPAYYVQTRSPKDHGCYQSVDVIRGRVIQGIGGIPDRLRVSLLRKRPAGCQWYDEETGGLSRQSDQCRRSETSSLRVSHAGRWRLEPKEPLPKGRYTFKAGGDVVRFRIVRS